MFEGGFQIGLNEDLVTIFQALDTPGRRLLRRDRIRD